ncbi:hypothetical protein LB518_11635 [Mesorhizobium sp. BR1-1-16]|uniref:hypothetical protein n=1 Tax=Mesorhizobium sp. BR1-1-16 TaxID=2876653 RepID=UPI001CCFAEEF|nr:hypothetical protein [Mesorhizobium sp. BR1-1-16]MBZ9936948.1 hypothetical protein [Mesorhizobium sp. BR1-1-16]
MSKIEQYLRGRDFCRLKADEASWLELRAIWNTLQASYSFLIELELRDKSSPRGLAGAGSHSGEIRFTAAKSLAGARSCPSTVT